MKGKYKAALALLLLVILVPLTLMLTLGLVGSRRWRASGCRSERALRWMTVPDSRATVYRFLNSAIWLMIAR